MLTSISAITLATHDMTRAVLFYQALGFALKSGGQAARFTSFHAGSGYLNLVVMPPGPKWSWWGRVIFYVDDVDAQYERAVLAGLIPEFSPRDGIMGRETLQYSRSGRTRTELCPSCIKADLSRTLRRCIAGSSKGTIWRRESTIARACAAWLL
jgi:catechol 2,3-dioxygenase-like lactoylglutathione lyase family enzyme